MRILCVAFAVLLAQGAAAGTRIETETRRLGVENPRVDRSVVRVEGNRMCLDPDSGQRSVIYRGDRDLAWLLNHREHSYLQVDRATTAAIARGRERANEVLREGIAGLSPQRRAAMERLLDSALGPVSAPPAVTVRATGRRDSIQRIACEEFELFRGKERFAQVCVADYGAAGLSPGTRKAVRELAVFLREAVTALAPKEFRQLGLDALDSFEQIEGFPLRVRAAVNGGPMSETLVTKIAEESIDPRTFDLPAGYRADLSLGGAE